MLLRVIPEAGADSQTRAARERGVEFNIKQLECILTAQDGQTVVTNDMKVAVRHSDEKKIPWLGDLPCVGTMFRKTTYSSRHTEIFVELTPRIIPGGVASPRNYDQANRFFRQQSIFDRK